MRSLSTGFQAAIAGQVVMPVILVSIQFSNETIYCWSGYGPLSWNGHTWSGLGYLGTIANLAEVSDLSAQNVTLMLEGIPNELVSDCINTANQSNAVQIYLGFMTTSNTLIADPVLVYYGQTDVPTITCGAQTSAISITCESPLVTLNQASNRVYSNADQWIDYPTDQGFTFVPAIQDWNGNWGTSGGNNPASSGSSIGGGGNGTTSGVGNGTTPLKTQPSSRGIPASA